MILIVDSNIIFAGLLRDSTTRKILIDSPFMLYAPETMLNEIRKHEDEIIVRSGLTKEEFEVLFTLLTGNIKIVEKQTYEHSLQRADELIGHIDKGDVPFLALALSAPNDGIWTENVRHFEKQDRVKTWTTAQLLNLLGLS